MHVKQYYPSERCNMIMIFNFRSLCDVVQFRWKSTLCCNFYSDWWTNHNLHNTISSKLRLWVEAAGNKKFHIFYKSLNIGKRRIENGVVVVRRETISGDYDGYRSHGSAFWYTKEKCAIRHQASSVQVPKKITVLPENVNYLRSVLVSYLLFYSSFSTTTAHVCTADYWDALVFWNSACYNSSLSPSLAVGVWEPINNKTRNWKFNQIILISTCLLLHGWDILILIRNIIAHVQFCFLI